MSKEILEQVKKESGIQILNIPYQVEIYIDYMMKLAFNKALEIAAESVKAYTRSCGDINTCGCMGRCEDSRPYVDKQSILKHKI